jgi:hypothetical protein
MKTNFKLVLSVAAVACSTLFYSCTKEFTTETADPANIAALDAHMRILKSAGNDLPAAANKLSQSDETIIKKSNCNDLIFPPKSHAYGKSYSQWSASWWKWSMEFPLAGHPFVDDPSFNVNTGQNGPVWFLAAPFGTVVRNVTIPHNKALFVGLLNTEASDLEGLGNTYTDQLSTAHYLADHIINLTASIDGRPVNNIASFRVASPQFSFTAPNPWIFSPAPSGAGTSVADGYYLLVKPLHHGIHTIHFTGSFHFTLADDGFDFDADIDMTYVVTVS